jgi:cyanophycinase
MSGTKRTQQRADSAGLARLLAAPATVRFGPRTPERSIHRAGAGFTTHTDREGKMTTMQSKRWAMSLVLVAGVAAAARAQDSVPGIVAKPEVVRVQTGFVFTEGPTADAAGNLYFTDVRASKILKLDAQGNLLTFLEDTQGANGLGFDARGRLIAAQGGAARIIAIDVATRAITVLADKYNGQPLARPNDLVVDRQGGVYFTDPDPKSVYYVAIDGRVTRLIDDLPRPNGVILSPDEATLYVVPSGSPDVMAYPVQAPGKIGSGRVLARLAQDASGPPRGGDGLAVDSAGNLYLAVPALKAIQVVSPAGKTLGMIAVPENPTNADFGGKDLKTLYITARTSLYAVQTEVKGHRFGTLARSSVGPERGALVIVGGGGLGPEIVTRFVALAGGPESEFVVIPTASETDPVDTRRARERFMKAFGVKNVSVLHTRDRAEADTDAFVAPLRTATAVWYDGGRQWRLVDSYLGTRTQRAIESVLARGGVIGGSSAGATIQGSYLVRGAREGNHIMMARGYEEGFGHLQNAAIDQHLLPRHREQDLIAVVEAHPELLGLGIDEATAVVVQGDRFEVIGRSVVGIYDGQEHEGKRYYFLKKGDQFDLKERRPVARLPRSSPETQGVSSSALLEFVTAADKNVDMMNGFVLVRHGYVVAEGWWAPYSAAAPHSLYSLSKSFTSTAVGLAVAEGKLSLDDEILKFFPEDAPAEASQNLRAMRVRDLLRMSTGHQAEPPRSAEKPWTQSFLAHPVPNKPGTHFLYNTSGTYMLSAIVQKATGMTVLDYLRPRLFEPLGIENPTWETSPQGVSAGGFGLSIRTEDIARFGQLYLQKGRWQGKELIPAAWVEEATARQTSNGSNPQSDWEQGYGYQFWRCRHGAYRGDGAFGQFCVVLPEQDAVVAINSGTRNMQGVLNLVWDKLLPALKPSPLAANDDARRRLEETLAGLAVPPQDGSATASPSVAAGFSGKNYVFPANDRKLETIALENGGSGVTLVARIDGTERRIACRPRAWQTGRLAFARLPEQAVAVSGAWTGDDTFSVKLCFFETPFLYTLNLKFSGDEVRLDSRSNVGFGPAKQAPLIGRAD